MGWFQFVASPERDPKDADLFLLIMVPVAMACVGAILWSAVVFPLWFAMLFGIAVGVLGFAMIQLLADIILPKKSPVDRED